MYNLAWKKKIINQFVFNNFLKTYPNHLSFFEFSSNLRWHYQNISKNKKNTGHSCSFIDGIWKRAWTFAFPAYICTKLRERDPTANKIIELSWRTQLTSAFWSQNNIIYIYLSLLAWPFRCRRIDVVIATCRYG